ncbi:GtrA family protein [Actinokineospora auranticolor]|uniref:Putative flippase GtrA n=1 Tax=Actinokineospora auranticolor TaxID=155976 RepID=A0A2S6GL40_9PSEU|nr:GtrA family protein [Actinokineospora auranticolor]PPK65939.1 putative flippase GtrA [Actinokineospora auranticolor]
MAEVSENPRTGVVGENSRAGLLSQLLRFVLVGGFCAVVDYGTYQLLLHLGLWVHLAKALSFILGTTTAYFLNKRFTFTDAADRGVGQAGGFVLLYTVTFFVNVGTNALMLAVLPEFDFRYAVAWVIAQGLGTAINFVLLRTVVFRS